MRLRSPALLAVHAMRLRSPALLAVVMCFLFVFPDMASGQIFGRRRNAPQQCPGGVCPAPQAIPFSQPLPNCPGGKCPPLNAVPAPAIEKVPPLVLGKPMAEGRPQHGRVFYRSVRDGVERRLIDRGIPPARARELVAGVSDTSIDTYASAVGIKQGVGDGGFVPWLRDHREQILQLIELLLTLLLAFADAGLDPADLAQLLDATVQLFVLAHA